MEIMLQFSDEVSAVAAFLQHFDDPRFFGGVHAMSVAEFRRKVRAADGEMVKSTRLEPRLRRDGVRQRYLVRVDVGHPVAGGGLPYHDGQLLHAADAARYYASEIAGKEKGVIVKNPIFVVGKLSAGQVASVAKYLRAGTAPSELRITGRSIKHADERRPDIVRALVAEFPLHFIENVVVLPNPQDNKKVLLVSTAHRTSSNKSYVAAVEVELRGDALYIASFMTMPDRTLRQAIELGANWQEGQQPPSGDSPHPVESLDAHAEAGFSDVPPIGDTTIPNPDEESTHKSLPADGAFTQEQHMEKIDFLKSHIDAYTRKDGTVVTAAWRGRG